MSQKFMETAGKKLFEKHLQQYAPQDPLYEFYTDKKGKQKRRKRELPPGLSDRDKKILQSIKKRAHYLDKGFNLCGFRFGWTAIIGLIPFAGDVADVSLNYLLVVRKAKQAEIPGWLLRRMLLNNAVAASIALVPLAGDVVMAAFKTNSRNAMLLEEFLRIRGEEYIKAQEGGRVPKKDAVQVKPGAGAGETGKPEASKQAVKEQVEAEQKMPGALNSNGSATASGSKSKRGSSLMSWVGGGSGKGKGKDISDKGRFVEDITPGNTAKTK